MGKNKLKKKKTPRDVRVQQKAAEKKHGASKTPAYNPDQLLMKAEESMDQFQFELASKFCTRVLDMDKDNLQALDMLGAAYLETGDLEAAKNSFERAVALSPDRGHGRHMYLGQLSTGAEAVRHFEEGIRLMSVVLARDSETEPEEPCTEKEMSCAYCSIAEIYLTDCCMEDDAESRCKECLDAALRIDEHNPEALQLLASFYLSKNDKESATQAIDKSVSYWLPWLREVLHPEGASVDAVEPCPISYQHRVTSAKILIEVGRYEPASEILEYLLDEEDEIVEVWYMLGWVNYLQGEDYFGNCRFYLRKALEIAAKTKYDDDAVLKHTNELLTTVGPDPADEVEEKNAEAAQEEDWETTDDEQEADMEDQAAMTSQNHCMDNQSAERTSGVTSQEDSITRTTACDGDDMET